MNPQENILQTLSEFRPISLKEMDSVKLMNRTDTKYFFHISKLPTILEAVKDHYFVLKIKDKRIASYKTLYFDTPDFRNYTNHHNGKLNRFKVRIRHYIDSDIFFLEEKFKNNKGRTIKKRIKVSEIKNSFSKKEKEFISQYTPLNPDELESKLLNHFQRITLVQPSDKERITIDINLGFSDTNENETQFQNIVIAEIKKDGRENRSKITEIFRQNRIYPSGFSKYCTGIISVHNQVKYNRFKYKLSQIKKIEYGIT